MDRTDRIDLNDATLEDLLFWGIDGARARALVRRREQLGGFHRWDELDAVPGFDAAVIRRLQQRATLLSRPSAAPTRR